MGGTAGVAIFLSILFTSLKDKGSQIAEGVTAAIQKNPGLLALPQNKDFMKHAKDLASDSSFLSRISPELAKPIKQAFSESAVQVFGSAAFVVTVAFILTWFVKEIKLRTKSGVQEQAEAKAAQAASMH